MGQGKPEHLEPSELGTKSYWDSCYDRELKNFAENSDDEGTVWFSDSGAEEKVIAHLLNLVDDSIIKKGDDMNDSIDSNAVSFLDLGTGNGHFLFALREEGFSGDMLGVDYSVPSVKLAQDIEVQRHRKGSDNIIYGSLAPVDFRHFDILSTAQLERQFDIVLDKGTFDAISLSSEIDSSGKRIVEQYISRIVQFLKKGGIFIITSCNWTAEELCSWFEEELLFEQKLSYPSFRFQGQEGQTVVTLIFVKNKSPA